METHFDVLIIGAGPSGIGMSCHRQKEGPAKQRVSAALARQGRNPPGRA
ncbi:hypothetical protein [Verminephrobacter aporrectodeae]|nr:hypothetical protein [Verminephrobacter aporrectodeae]